MRLLAGFLFLLLSCTVQARPLDVWFWNLESPGHGEVAGETQTADIEFLCRRIERDFSGAHLVGFCEVEPDWGGPLKAALEKATGAEFELILSPTGGHDRLAIAWRKKRFYRLDALAEHPPQGIQNVAGPFPVDGQPVAFRPTVFVRLQDTEGGQNFTFCVSHLARSNRANGSRIRRMQTRILRDWLAQVQAPVISVGDFNFDYHISEGDRDDSGFTVLTRDDLYKWVRYPEPLVTTYGKCQKPGDSVLDFIFTANEARNWPARSQIVQREDDFCPDSQNSDHRPVRAMFDIP